MSEAIREMFATIAPRYDLANELLSLGIHRRWRRSLVKRAGLPAGASVLDCATGTGDLALEFARAVGPTGSVTGIDFCEPMLAGARDKARAAGLEIDFRQADAQNLPFDGGRFDLTSIAFGIRNVDDPARCLREMARVVRPGGQVWVLEFGQPAGPFGALYRFYNWAVVPNLGHLVTGKRSPYRYLPTTAKAFPAGDRFLSLMREAGVFSETSAVPLTFGVAYLYRGITRASK
jgi:demethylmenaquinone methyltransferase/2-methoxy-6-polyprenyl-1,4-benzoquinol methylase